MGNKKRQLLLLVIILIINLFGLPHQTLHAAGTVGTGTAASCTEAAFNAALVGGGTINFNCGSDPVTITITRTKTIAVNTSIQGNQRITLRGNGLVQLFMVNATARLSLSGLTLTNGKAPSGGAILNRGSLIIMKSTFTLNTATQGGAIYHDSAGLLIITASDFTFNQANEKGGAIMSTADSRWQILGSRFSLNSVNNGSGSAIYGSGAISNTTFSGNVSGLGSNWGYGTVVTERELHADHCIFEQNVAHGGGTGIYVVDGATNVTVSFSEFTRNTGTAFFVGGGTSTTSIDISYSVFDGNGSRSNSDTNGSAIVINSYSSNVHVSYSRFTANSNTGRDNYAFWQAGGAISVFNGSLNVDHTTFSRNLARRGGAIGVVVGIHNFDGVIVGFSGKAFIDSSTFDSNQATERGGGLYYLATPNAIGEAVSVINSTFYGNRAPTGGGLALEGSLPLRLTFVTIANNDPNGIYTYSADSILLLQNSIIANNVGANCAGFGFPASSGSLEFPGRSCGAAFFGSDPLLGTLANNGGYTQTMALLPGSPAIDKVPPLPPSNFLDQRDAIRPQDGNGDGMFASDIGAFEVADQNGIASTSSSLTETCENFAAAPIDTLPDGIVTFTWKPNPVATSYHFNFYDGVHTLLQTHTLSAGVSSISLDMSQKAVGTGTTFFWQIEALRGQEVLCMSELQLTRKAASQPNSVVPTNTPKP